MSEWQSIKTAPARDPGDDQVRILVWVEDGGDNRKGVCAFGRVYKGHDGKKHPVAEGYSGKWKITHWQPLPDGPTEERKQP